MSKTCQALAFLAVCAAAASFGEEGQLVLDETAYWRYHLTCRPVRVCPEQMKAGGEKLLSKRMVLRLKRAAARRPAQAAGGSDWTENVTCTSATGDRRTGAYYALLGQVSTTPPADGWMKPAFDDADWARHREPYLLGRASLGRWGKGGNRSIQLGCLRTTFQVADPSRVRSLDLRAVYRGGLRVFLNGKEVARGHVAQGSVTPSTAAAEYPVEAYRLLDGEYPQSFKPPKSTALAGAVPLVGELRGRFEQARDRRKDAPAGFKSLKCGLPVVMNKTGWDRIQRLRDRQLEVNIRPDLLVKRTNHLAVELRAADMHPLVFGWWIDWVGNAAWEHCWLTKLSLRASGSGVVPARRRPSGMWVWVEDIHHRLYSPEFCPPGQAVKAARIVAARNGTYAAQIAVGTGSPLAGLKAKVGALRLVGGSAALPASAAAVYYGKGRSAFKLITLGEYKSLHVDAFEAGGGMGDEGPCILDRHGPPGLGAGRDARLAALKSIACFDQLSSDPPPQVPTGSCHPIWISVSVPPDARPGTYRGAVEISAQATERVSVPLEVEVIDWRVPAPQEFQTVVALEQSPYAVARRYNVEPWSAEHFRLMEPSFALLAKVGNDWLNVPVLSFTEFGNLDDSPIRISRTRDGGYTCDFTILDRYLDLAIRHLGVPRVINFVLNQPGRPGDARFVSAPLQVHVLDGRTGKKVLLDVGRKMPPAERRRFFGDVATAIYGHMKTRSLENSIYWGLPWDGEADPALPALLAGFVPSVRWARFSHGFRPNETFTAVATLFGHEIGLTSRKGWKQPVLHMVYPRNQGSVITCFGSGQPFLYRLLPDRLLVAGANGVARLGADYWADTWLKGWKGRLWMPGLPCRYLFYPAAAGAETSVRFEMLREGLQEAEARIFLEQAAEKLGDQPLKKRIADVLDAHSHDTMILEPRISYVKHAEHSTGWQVRSRRLYRLAAEVAGRMGLGVRPNHIAVQVSPRGSARLNVTLRNWTSQPRAWSLASDRAWARPALREGVLAPGRQKLGLILDGSGLAAGQKHQAALVLTDASSGRTETVTIAATVNKVFTLDGRQTVLNVTADDGAGEVFTICNRSGARLSWRAAASPDWLAAEPAAGTLDPDRTATLTLRASPPAGHRARHEGTLTVVEAGGTKEQLALVVHVLPPRRRATARPAGKAVPLHEVSPKLLKSYVVGGGRSRGAPRFHQPGNGKLAIGKARKGFSAGFYAEPRCELTYGLKDTGFDAFAAEVGPSHGLCHPAQLDWAYRLKLHFEIYVDGELRDHSGLMDVTDPPRLLVVDGLAGARQIKLVTRVHDDSRARPVPWPQYRRPLTACWAEPTLYTKPGQ
jgi:hypothetical protein